MAGFFVGTCHGLAEELKLAGSLTGLVPFVPPATFLGHELTDGVPVFIIETMVLTIPLLSPHWPVQNTPNALAQKSHPHVSRIGPL